MHQGRLALLVHEVLGHGAAGIRGDVLHRGRVAGAGGDDDRVVQGAVAAEDVDQGGRGRFLLGDRHVDADDAGPLLVQDRVDGDGRLAGLAVADDQLALAAADRGHGVDRLDAGLQRLVDRLPLGDARGDRFQRPGLVGQDRALVVDRLAQGVDHAADHRLADRHAEQVRRSR